MSSRISSSPQHLHPEKPGILTPLQSQRRHAKILYQDINRSKKYWGISCHNNLDSTESFSSSYKKQRTYRNLLLQKVGTVSDAEFVLQPNADRKVTVQSTFWDKWDAFYRFCRMYTVTGMSIAVMSVSLLPVTSIGDLSPALLVGVLQALIPIVFVNIYVGGINQLVDVEIDKINKPYYPLASGELSVGQGKALVSAFGFTCLALGVIFQSPPLFSGVFVYFLLGTAYSIELPLLRWKTNPYLAAICIVGGHGLTIHHTVFYHIQHVLGKPLAFTKSLGFISIFFGLFIAVLALFKDIPDVEGDRAFGNRTFSVRHGKKKVFSICLTILLIAYGFGVVIGASSSFLICKIVSVIGHCTVACILLFRAKSVNLDDDVSTESFYMLLWKLCYAEYFLIHFIR